MWEMATERLRDFCHVTEESWLYAKIGKFKQILWLPESLDFFIVFQGNIWERG